MEIYALNNTYCIYQESDPLGNLHSSRKESNVDCCFEELFLQPFR